MQASFVLELDTTPPAVTIYSPSYAIRGGLTEITVQASETLGVYQDIYLVDADGIRHDLIFQYLGDKYVGYMDFNGLPVGIATFFATLRDEVHNLSNLAVKSINILEAADLRVVASDTSRQIASSSLAREVVTLELSSRVTAHEKTRDLVALEATQQVRTGTQTREILTDSATREIAVEEGGI